MEDKPVKKVDVGDQVELVMRLNAIEGIEHSFEEVLAQVLKVVAESKG